MARDSTNCQLRMKLSVRRSCALGGRQIQRLPDAAEENALIQNPNSGVLLDREYDAQNVLFQ
jgi:hypothetical protein